MSAVPKLRFPEYQGAFETKLLEEIADVYQPKTISQSDLTPNGKYVVYGANGVIGRYSDFNHEAEQVAITCRGNTCGRVNFTPSKAWITGNAMVLNMDANAEVSKKFIYYLSTATDWTYQIAGSGQPQITGTIKKHKFKIPTLPEQQKIASFLSSVDKKIDLLRQKKDALELCKKGLMQKLFSQKIRFKQDDGSDFPDWEEVTLSEIAKRSTEKNKDLELTLVLTNSAVQGVVVQTEYFDKSIANEANISGYYKVRKSDFVYNPRISSAAPVGPISQNMKDDGVMSPLYTVFRVGEPYQRFLNVYFKSSVWFDYMRSIANQGARHDRMNITTSDFMALPIDLPCAREREKIASFLSSIDVKIQNTSSQIEQMETYKKGLLQQMFV